MAQEEGPPTIAEITCQEMAQLASAYLDEHVEGERKRQITTHLSGCAGCETYMKQIATVRNVVALLPNTGEEPSDPHRLRWAFAARARSSPADD